MSSDNPPAKSSWLPTFVSELFGLDHRTTTASVLFAALATAFAVFWFFHSAPPMRITITTGPEGSSAYTSAKKYADILARSKVKVDILPSEGSIQNIQRLTDPDSHVDLGLVQGGLADEAQAAKLVSLGDTNHQPLLIFYRAPRPVRILSEFSGKRLAVGPEGSGTRILALALLADNGIKPGGPTKLEEVDAQDAGKALLSGNIDAAFLMGDSAPTELIRELLHDQQVRLYSFVQANAYVRKFNYLNKMVLPEGGIDFGKDIPPSEVDLVGPTVEIVARPEFDPALTDLFLEAAKEVHGGGGLFKHQGDFPAPQRHEFPISSAAAHFYTSGKSFFYRFLPFWIASMVDRVLVTLVPLLIILIPGVRAIPAALRWRINLVIYRWYRLLLKVERDVVTLDLKQTQKDALLGQLDRIEKEVNSTKVPVAFATQFYELRGHINFVRDQLDENPDKP
jgi:TRAP-type uncharacterized transport system substrate-binding protein